MRRRLDLAAALVARPTVLFLDEPTTGLDPQSRNDLWEVIERLVGGGTTVLLTTQYLEEADRLADTPGRARPRSGHRRGHAGRVEGRPGRHRAGGRAGHRSTTPPGTADLLASLGPHHPASNGTVVEVTVDDGTRSRPWPASARLDQEGITPSAFTLREPSLDDVFLALTGRRAEDEAETDRGRRTETSSGDAVAKRRS